MATATLNFDFQAMKTLLLVKLLLVIAVFLTVRGWNPVEASPADFEEVKVVNDQHTPDANNTSTDLLPVDCKDKNCSNSL